MQGNLLLDDLLKDLPPDLARGMAYYGVKLAIELLQTLLADLSGEAAPEPARKKLGRPRKKPELPKVLLATTAKSGWSTDPEERKREAARRLEVRRKKKQAALHPRDPNHPGHAKWAAAIGKKTRRSWDGMSPAKRKARLAAMAAGRERAKLEAVAEAVA